MRKIVRNQKGFTLVEIIAVLVILGILAAFAIPKYFNLQDDAKNRALQGALAEGKARVNQYAAQYLLTAGSWPADYVASAVGTNAGDFTLSFAGNASSVSITAEGTTGAVDGVSSAISIMAPGRT
ncbi:MAG: prepilin-type N-terminal cleavage/methylation domain-containing protein [Deltaproteobacteria bacterium]|nr:prepilin-type N-terminal cleavage/methylation domain-containing protein [Deltaproteobacteria bacterium]